MRLYALLHLLGPFLMIVGGFMLIPLVWSLYYREGDALAILISMLITVGTGGAFRWIAPQSLGSIRTSEGFAMVTVGWLAATLFGSLPYVFAGTFDSYIDAFFETMAGFTTTGSSVLRDIEAQPHGILMWRSLTQWIGGIGIVALFVAVLPALGGGAFRLVQHEAPGPAGEKIVPRVRQMAKILWIIYGSMSAALLALLVIAGMPFFDSMAHTFSAMSTGGFSPKNASIGAYDNFAAEIILIVFMVLAGGNFSVYFWVTQGQGLRAWRDPELRLYLQIVLVASIAIALDLYYHLGESLGHALRLATFQVATIQTTTGFMTADFDQWPSFAKEALVALMFIGGSAGSTAGAIKVLRLLVAYKYVLRELYQLVHPKAVIPLKIGRQVVRDRVLGEVLAYSMLYLLTFTVAALLLAAMGLSPVSAFTASATAIGNVGPGLEMVGPTKNFADVPDLGKVVLGLTMLLGRLEFWTVMILLVPALWRKR